MISKSTDMGDVFRQLTAIDGAASEENFVAALRHRRNGMRLASAIRDLAGEGEIEIVSGFVAGEADSATSAFRRAVVRHGDGRVDEVTINEPESS